MKSTVKLAVVLWTVLTPVIATADWDAVVDWAQKTTLTTATSGVIDKVRARPGETVEKGALLLQLDQRALHASVADGKAAQEYAGLLRDEAARELERAEELYARTLLADHDLNLAKIDYAKAESVYQNRRSQYLQALEALRNSELRAPFKAVVLARRVEPAQTVVSRLQVEPMLIIASADKRLARFSVTAAALGDLSPGSAVSVKLEGNTHQGEVTAVEASADVTGEFTIEVIFDNAAAVVPGTSVRVTRR